MFRVSNICQYTPIPLQRASTYRHFVSTSINSAGSFKSLLADFQSLGAIRHIETIKEDTETLAQRTNLGNSNNSFAEHAQRYKYQPDKFIAEKIEFLEDNKILRKPVNYKAMSKVSQMKLDAELQISELLDGPINGSKEPAHTESEREAAKQQLITKYEKGLDEQISSIRQFLGQSYDLGDHKELFSKLLDSAHIFDYNITQSIGASPILRDKIVQSTISTDKLQALGKSLYNISVTIYLAQSSRNQNTTRVYQFRDPSYYKIQDAAIINNMDFENVSDKAADTLCNENIIAEFIDANRLMASQNLPNNGITIPILHDPTVRKHVDHHLPVEKRIKQQLLQSSKVQQSQRNPHSDGENPFVKYVKSKEEYGRLKKAQRSRINTFQKNRFFYLLIGLIDVKFGLHKTMQFVENRILLGKKGAGTHHAYRDNLTFFDKKIEHWLPYHHNWLSLDSVREEPSSSCKVAVL